MGLKPVISPEIACRDNLPWLALKRGLLNVAVEVGTLKGHFSDYFVNNWPGEVLVCIDPWSQIGQYNYNREIDYLSAVTRLTQHGDRVDIWRLEDSEQHADFICYRWGTPQFVFLDADHTYEGTKKSIDIWWPRLASNGILAGHDYDTKWFDGVIKAVDEFTDANGLQLLLCHKVRYKTWYVYKDQTTPLIQEWETWTNE
jgi:hypothetical protein